MRWIGEAAFPLREMLAETEVPNSGYWGYDEIHMEIGGHGAYQINIVDLATKFIQNARISRICGKSEARHALMEAKRGNRNRKGQIKGIVSDRDLKLALSIKSVDPLQTKVDEIINSEIFLTSPDARLDEVVRMMAKEKINSVLVVKDHRLVGIFTTSDAMKALGELMDH